MRLGLDGAANTMDLLRTSKTAGQDHMHVCVSRPVHVRTERSISSSLSLVSVSLSVALDFAMPIKCERFLCCAGVCGAAVCAGVETDAHSLRHSTIPVLFLTLTALALSR